jgi:hypothetical protein
MKLKILSVFSTALTLLITTALTITAPSRSAQAAATPKNLVNLNSNKDGLVLAAERVYFRRNTTGADLEGTLQGGQHRDYVLTAGAGQTMSTSTMGTSDFLVQVFAPSGRNLYTGTDNWSGQLPSTGDYHLRISLPPGQESSESQNYKLTVVVE